MTAWEIGIEAEFGKWLCYGKKELNYEKYVSGYS